jgi:hypothetical protein
MKKTSRQLVLEAVQDLHALEQIVTRETLAEHTGLKLTVVDDRIATLVDDGDVLRVQRGVFVPAPVHPPSRPISKTVLPGGMVKLEIGDQVLDLTPRENRMLGDLMAGAGVQYAQIETGHSMAVMVAEMRREMAALFRVQPAEKDGDSLQAGESKGMAL